MDELVLGCKPTTLDHNLAEAAADGDAFHFDPAIEVAEMPGKHEGGHVVSGVSPAAVKPRRRAVNMTWSDYWAFEMVGNKAHAVVPGDSAPSSRSKRLPNPVTPAASQSTGGTLGSGSSSMPSTSAKRICSCKKSKCLKLYCECFSAGVVCDGCKCVECANDGGHEEERLAAVEAIKSRNALAFAPKILEEEQQDKGHHARGCRCKKSHCLKKYCECYQAAIKCGDKCKCEECHNRSDGPDQAGVTPRERAEPLTLRSQPSSGMSSAGSSAMRVSAGDSLLSPPRNKKPRVLDFDVFSTPAGASVGARPGASPIGAPCSTDADAAAAAPARHMADQLQSAAGSLFDSPCSSFLAVP